MSNRTIFPSRTFINNISSTYSWWDKEWTKILRDNQAIIAGGSVLAGINTNTAYDDIDIYVNLRNAQNFRNKLKHHYSNTTIFDAHLAPAYDQSFLIKNNILGRLSFVAGRKMGDIMIVSDDVTLESVVENFDLSFCKVWFDGKDILTNYPDDVKKKNGVLGVDYFKNLLSGNLFTTRRIKKYIRRGYTIKLPNIQTKGIIMKKANKTVISPSMWVVYKLIEQLLQLYNLNYNVGEYPEIQRPFSIMIFLLQKLNEFKLARRVDTIYNINVFKDLLRFLYPEETLTGNFYNINKLIYVLITSDKKCVWLPTNYIEYFKSIGIQLTNKNGIPAHGFDNEDIPLCDGELPPFSAGKSGISFDASERDIKEIKDAGEKILKNTPEKLLILLYNLYPTLAAQTAAQRMARIQEEHRLAAQRFAAINQDEDEDEDEATEPYNLPNNQQVSGRCFSIMDGHYINTSSWYPEDDSILLLVEFNDAIEPTLVCTNREIFELALSDESRINYKCAATQGFIPGTGEVIDLTNLENIPDGVAIDLPMRDIDFNKEYIPFAYGFDGTTVMNGYITRNEVEWILSSLDSSSTRLFTLRFKDTITHTVSKNNTDRGTQGRDVVSTNHCQAGSAIMVFEVTEYSDVTQFTIRIQDVDEDVDEDEEEDVDEDEEGRRMRIRIMRGMNTD
jgi:hypothetical protein